MLNNYFQFLRTTRIAKSTIIVLFFSMLGAGLVAQENKHLAGTSKSPTEHSKKGFKDGSNILGLHYLNQNICGLNYVEDDTLVETRSASAGFNAGGTGLPSAIKLRGLPTGCDSILKAYLYFSTSYNSGPANPATVSVTNPASSLFTYNGDTVGGSTTVGWGESGTACYRTDVTTSISGNGVYAINITGAGCSGTEVDGLSLFVIYRDLSATYSGSLAIYDGEMSICTGSSFDYSATGFDVCANAPNAMAFGVMSDMQANVNGGINDQTFNGTSAAFSNNFWNYDTIRTTLTAGQTSTTYDTYTNNTSDCYSLTVAGLYWQNTTCVACVGSSGSLSLTGSTVKAGCSKSNGSATVTPSGGTPPYTYSWSNGSTNQTDSNLAAGSYTVHVTAKGVCSNSNDSLVLVVVDSSAPTITIVPPVDTLCPGSNVLLTASGGVTYAWSPAAGLSATTGASVTAAPGSTTTYVVLGTNASGCSGSASITVDVRTPPAITITPPADSICKGDSVKLLAGGALSYVWSPAAGLSCTNCPNPSVSPSSTTTYTVKGTDLHGCIDSASIKIKVNLPPVVTITPPKDSVCSGSSVLLTASGASSYMWSPSGSISCTTCTSVLAFPSSNTTYTLIGTSASGCVDTAKVTVTVNPLPLVTVAPPNDTICPGSNVSLTASGASTYSWSPAAGLSATTGATVNAGPTSNTTYTVTGTDASGCDNTATVTVTLRSFLVISAGRLDSICKSDSAKLNITGAVTYSWAPAAGLSCTACPNPSASPASTTTYTVTGTNSHGCSDTATIKIKVNPLPVIIVTPPTDSICPGGSATLTASGANAYAWSPAASVSCTNCASTLVSPKTNTIYTVVGTSISGCVDSATAMVSIKPFPIVTVVPPKDSICPGTSVSVVASAKGAVSYSWSPAAGLSCTTCANPNVSPAVTTTYTVTVSNGTCAHDTTVTIKVLPPAVAGITSPVEICVGKDTTLTATGGGTYKWSTGATTSSITVTPSANTTYSVMVTSTNGCKDSASSAVLVDVPSFNVCCDTSIIKGATVVLSTNTSNVVAYVWTPGSGLNCYTCPIVSANPTVNTTYTIMGTDSNGCVTFRTVTVDILCSDFVVPNVFTPNGDGKNDVFLIDVTKYDSYNIEIFDRWGVKMYEANTTNAPWDGKTTAGQDAPDGVYYYIIKATCGGNDYDKKGFVQIIR